MLKIRWFRVLLITVVLVLAITYPILWLKMLNDPVQYTGTDYVPFYAASQISRNEGTSQVYDLELQRKYEENLGNFVIQPEDVRIFLNPPFIIPLANLVSKPDFRTSLILWELVNFLILLLGTYLLFNLLNSYFSWKILLVFLAGIITFFPAYKSLIIGQNSAILLFGAIMLFIGTVEKKDWMAGLGLAIITVRPHIALPLALPFLFNRKRIFYWFLAGAAFLGLISLGYSGLDGVKGFLEMLLVSGSGSNSTTGENSMVNLIGILLRLFPGASIEIVHLLGWGAYILSIGYLCYYWKNSFTIGGKQISVAVLITTITVPHIHMHDLVLWILPLTMILLITMGRKDISLIAASIPWWVSFAFLICFFSPILEAIIPYILYCLLFFLIIRPEKLKLLKRSKAGGIS